MVFADYMNQYLSVGDEKLVNRVAKRGSFRPVLQHFRVVQILTNIRMVEGFCRCKCTVGGFVDEIMVFADYMNEYLSDGDEKLVVREAKRSSFPPILHFSRRTLCAGPVSQNNNYLGNWSGAYLRPESQDRTSILFDFVVKIF